MGCVKNMAALSAQLYKKRLGGLSRINRYISENNPV